MNIIFLDFDGPMIPSRAYFMPQQTRPIVSVFDPAAVGLINRLAEKAEAKIVIHSSWRKTVLIDDTLVGGSIKSHIIAQGIKEEYLHEDLCCPFKFTSNRWHDISFWLEDRPEVTNYVIIEDEPIPYGLEELFKDKHISIDFDEGLTFAKYKEALIKLTGNDETLLV